MTSPVRRQRLSAYAMVVRGGAVLLTQLSRRSTRPGAWTLPGGGLNHGEDPRAALVREVYEETGLRAEPGRLLDLHSLHHEGVAPDGVLEDYHSVQMVFEASVAPDSPTPHVIEQDGTTEAAAWVPLSELAAGRVEAVELVHLVIAAEGAAVSVGDLPDKTGEVSAVTVRRVPESARRHVEALRAELETYAAAVAAGDNARVSESLADMLAAIYGTAREHGVPVSVLFSKRHSAARWGNEVLEIRTLSPDDWQVWRTLRLTALAEAPYAFSSRLADWQGENDSDARWRSRLSIPGSLNLLAVLDDQQVAIASGVPTTDDGIVEVISMWVAPAARGRGIGDALVHEVEQWARDRGARSLRLCVAEGNRTASELYLRNGFRYTGELGDLMPDGGGRERVMAKQLESSAASTEDPPPRAVPL